MNQQPNTVLIIDDDERNIFALSAVLKNRGFQCLSAVSGNDGLRIMKATPGIDVVLADMMMPGMDGYELLSIIRREPGVDKLPVIAVTAQAMPGDREKCIAAGADAYVSKPVDIDKLMNIMHDLFNTGRASV